MKTEMEQEALPEAAGRRGGRHLVQLLPIEKEALMEVQASLVREVQADRQGIIDLHVHSNASDGTLSPSQVVNYLLGLIQGEGFGFLIFFQLLVLANNSYGSIPRGKGISCICVVLLSPV